MRTTRRDFVRLVGLGGASAALSGCDSAAREILAALHPEPGSDFRPPASSEIDLVSHAINRLTYGARPGDYARVRAMSVEAFIEEQLEPQRLDDARCGWRLASLESLHEPAAELYEWSPEQLLAELTRARILRGVYSARQLHELMVDFWTDHLNIASQKGDCRWLKVADDRDVIRAHALGRFRDLIRASALSPAMLIYLDGHDNKVEHPGDRPNENYARELLELHTLGVHGGYTQADVMEVARCLSGWTYENRPFRFRAARVDFEPGRHDDGAKTVLGRTIPAGGGAGDLERVLDVVCAHPSTARHVATKLARYFVADPAPPEAVEAAAGAFSASQGDIRQTLRALFATESFRAARGNLFKRPMRFVISALRATDCPTGAGRTIVRYLERMGHAPFQYPTPEGYPLEAQPWLGGLLWRWNFALGLEWGRLEGATLDAGNLRQRLGGLEGLAAHLLGRTPTPLELDVLNQARSPLAVLLAGPAFQWH